MNLRQVLSWLLLIVLLAGCNPASVQYPVGSTPYPPPPTGIASGARSSSPQSVLQPPSSTDHSDVNTHWKRHWKAWP